MVRNIYPSKNARDEPPQKRSAPQQPDSNDSGKCFNKKIVSVETHPKFKITRRIYRILFQNLDKCPDPKQSLLDSLNESLELILHNNPGITKVGISLQSPALDGNINLPLIAVERNIVQILGNELFKLQQSEKMVPLFDHQLHASFTTYIPPTGRGFDPLMGNIDPENMIDVTIQDNYCLFHAIIAAMKYVTLKGNRNKQNRFNQVYKNITQNESFLTQAVLDLLQEADIDPSLDGYGMKHAEQLQNYFIKTYGTKYCILIFGTSSYTKPVFKGNVENPEFYLNIFYFKEHFYAIKNLNLFCCGKRNYYYCVPCELTYSNAIFHRASCPRKCIKCNRIGRDYPCKKDEAKYCSSCHHTFPNQDCFNHHLKNKTCGKFVKCEECFITYKVSTKQPHTCGDSFCRKCRVYHNKKGHCYIQPVKINNETPVRYVVFDFETTQDTVVGNNVFEHEVNFVCAYVFCTDCLLKPNFMEGECNICGPKIKKWSAAKGDKCIYEFTKWIIYDLNNKVKTIALSHFGGRFDNIFVLKQLYKLNLNPECVKNGNKFFEISVKKGKNTTETIFKDSFNFMSVPLSALVKTFNLNIQEKMFFPFLFNSSKNYSVKLSHLPDKSYYLFKTFSKSKQQEFNKWYDKNYATPFYLPEQLDEYCTNDVEILAYAVVEFRKIFLNVCDMDPFKESCTIAGACMKTYRSKFLPKDTLAIVPEFGYQKRNTCSTTSLKYFTWLQHTTGKQIQHGNSPQGEFKVGKYSVDAYIKDENRIIEFYGCAFHGHSCFKPNTILPTKRTAEYEYQ